MAETITLRRSDEYEVPVLFRGIGRFSRIVVVDDPHRGGLRVIFEPNPDQTVASGDAREVYRDYATHLRKQLEEEQKLHRTTILRTEPQPMTVWNYDLSDVSPRRFYTVSTRLPSGGTVVYENAVWRPAEWGMEARWEYRVYDTVAGESRSIPGTVYAYTLSKGIAPAPER